MRALIPHDYLWLAQALLTFLVLGLLFSLAVGVLLLANPPAAFALGERLNRWVDTSEFFRKLETPRSSERFFYRHHRIIGTLVTAGAAMVLWRWVLAVPRATVKAVFAGRHLGPSLDWMVPALDWILVALHAGVLVIGIVIFFRPSLLKGLEGPSNRWHKVPAAPFDAVITTVDSGFALYPRLSGLFLVLAAASCLVFLVPLLLGRLEG